MRHLCLDHLRQMLIPDTSICVIDCGVSLVRYAIIHIHLWMSTTVPQRNLLEVQHPITKKDRKEKIRICKMWRETFWAKKNTLKLRKKASVCERDENRSFLSLYMMKMNNRATVSQPNKKQTIQRLSSHLLNASKTVRLPMTLTYTST